MPLWIQFVFRAAPVIQLILEWVKRCSKEKRASISEKIKAILKRHDATRDEGELKDDLLQLSKDIGSDD